MQTDLITKVYFNEHLTHSCVGMPFRPYRLVIIMSTGSVATSITIPNAHISRSNFITILNSYATFNKELVCGP